MSDVASSNEMFFKLAMVIVCGGVTGLVLLSLRQDRLQAANEFAEARLRVRMFNEQVSTIRAELATKITPDRIEEMAEELGVQTKSWMTELSQTQANAPEEETGTPPTHGDQG